MPGLPKPPACLVAEDQALIGMLVEEQVEDCGFAVVGPFATCAAALAAVRESPPDLAVVDYFLSDGPCLDLVRELRRRSIPFAVLSGYDPAGPENQIGWKDVVWLRKPIAQEALQETLRGLWPEFNRCRTRTDSFSIAPN